MLFIRVDEGKYDQERPVTLNGEIFWIRFRFNSTVKTDGWFMDILDADRNILMKGRRVTTTDLTPYNDVKKALQGTLICYNIAQDREPLTKYNFHSEGKYRIIYMSQDEIDELS